MTFLSVNLGADVKEPEIAPEDTYDLIVSKAEVIEENGKMNIRCIILFDGMPDYAPIYHYLSLPVGGDDEDKKRIKQLMLKRFLVAFNIEYSEEGLELASILGGHGKVPVIQDVYEGRRSNKLRLPPLPAEAVAA